ncbi:MAG: hypothetical protein WCO52_04720 [bacterium]
MTTVDNTTPGAVAPAGRVADNVPLCFLHEDDPAAYFGACEGKLTTLPPHPKTGQVITCCTAHRTNADTKLSNTAEYLAERSLHMEAIPQDAPTQPCKLTTCGADASYVIGNPKSRTDHPCCSNHIKQVADLHGMVAHTRIAPCDYGTELIQLPPSEEVLRSGIPLVDPHTEAQNANWLYS